MKKTMKIIILTFISITSLNSFAQINKKAKADEDTKKWRYEVQCVGVGNQGTKLIKVFSYSKKSSIAIEQAKKMQFMQ